MEGIDGCFALASLPQAGYDDHHGRNDDGAAGPGPNGGPPRGGGTKIRPVVLCTPSGHQHGAFAPGLGPCQDLPWPLHIGVGDEAVGAGRDRYRDGLTVLGGGDGDAVQFPCDGSAIDPHGDHAEVLGFV